MGSPVLDDMPESWGSEDHLMRLHLLTKSLLFAMARSKHNLVLDPEDLGTGWLPQWPRLPPPAGWLPY